MMVAGILLVSFLWAYAFYRVAERYGGDPLAYTLAGFLLGPAALFLLLGEHEQRRRDRC